MSVEAVISCLSSKVFPQVTYAARFAPWRLSGFKELDREVSKLLCKATHNQTTFPVSLLYIPKSMGGLGFRRLSDTLQDRKMAALLRLEYGSPGDRHLAESLLGRALRGIGVTCSHGFDMPLRSDYLKDLRSDTWWVTSLLEWLEEAGLTLHINGPDQPADNRPLFIRIRAGSGRAEGFIPMAGEAQCYHASGKEGVICNGRTRTAASPGGYRHSAWPVLDSAGAAGTGRYGVCRRDPGL